MAKKLSNKTSIATDPPISWWQVRIFPRQIDLYVLLRIVAVVAVTIVVLLYAMDWLSSSMKSNFSGNESDNVMNSTKVDVVDSVSAPDLDNDLVEMPEDFPSEVPVVDGSYIEESRSEVANRKAWTLTVVTNRKLNQALAEIKKQFSDRNWSIDSELVDDRGVTYAASIDFLSVVVYITSKHNLTEIQYTVNERSSSVSR